MDKRKLTKKQTKELTLEVWEYLRDNPEIAFKNDLPEELFNKIEYLFLHCPLCELYKNKNSNSCKKNCPLNKASNDYGCCDGGENDFYQKWCIYTNTNDQRQDSASGIVELIKKWRV